MKTTIDQLNGLLKSSEGMNLEFKEAKGNFSKDKLYAYCCALSNEGGGKLIFGVVDKTHQVRGTKIFSGTEQILSVDILNTLGIRVDFEEIIHPDGRVLVAHIPSAYDGKPVKSGGVYWMRAGEGLVPMDEMTLFSKINLRQQDFSATIVDGLKISDLDPDAFRVMRLFLSKKGNIELAGLDDSLLLSSLELLNKNGINYAGLILLGKREKIREHLPSSEIIFEWRQVEKISHDFRKEWTEPFLKIYDDIWKTISDRNIRTPIQEGLFQGDILAFNQEAIREALLNAVTHRIYSNDSQSVFIKANTEEIIFVSPGGLLPGITPENIIEKHESRNRRISEVFQKLGFVERSGQGMDKIFESTISEGKGLPDLSSSDSFQVVLKIPARVKDKNFVLFLEKLSRERQINFLPSEIFELELLREGYGEIGIKNRKKFLELGVIERIGETSGSKYILSHKYYVYDQKPGEYTRIKGLSRLHKKELILEHIKREGHGRNEDFIALELTQKEVANMLQELKKDKKIMFIGSRRNGLWKLFQEGS